MSNHHSCAAAPGQGTASHRVSEAGGNQRGHLGAAKPGGHCDDPWRSELLNGITSATVTAGGGSTARGEGLSSELLGRLGRWALQALGAPVKPRQYRPAKGGR